MGGGHQVVREHPRGVGWDVCRGTGEGRGRGGEVDVLSEEIPSWMAVDEGRVQGCCDSSSTRESHHTLTASELTTMDYSIDTRRRRFSSGPSSLRIAFDEASEETGTIDSLSSS